MRSGNGRRGERGSSLVETMMAALVIAVAVLGTTGSFVMAAKTSSITWRRSTAQHVLAQRLDRLRLEDQSALEALSGDFQLDTRFDEAAAECPAGHECPDTNLYTSCLRRITPPPADPTAPAVTQVAVRVDWGARDPESTSDCQPDASLGGRYVTYMFSVAR